MAHPQQQAAQQHAQQQHAQQQQQHTSPGILNLYRKNIFEDSLKNGLEGHKNNDFMAYRFYSPFRTILVPIFIN